MTSELDHTHEKPPAVVGTPDDSEQPDDEPASSPGAMSPERKPVDFDSEELVFDKGFKAWSQVIGSFFLFVNSWYDALSLAVGLALDY